MATTTRGWKRLIEPDMLVAFSAMVVGVCALVVSVVEVRIMRQEQRANAWPRVEAFVNTGNDFVMRLTNKGFGPALIRGLVVSVDGSPARDWNELTTRLLRDTVAFTQSKITDTVIAPQDEIQIFRPSNADSLGIKFSSVTGRIGIEVCYCSIYDDCWWLRRPSFAGGGRWRHEEVESCSIDDNRRFSM
jgi:Co/Zn/Cd efflux system component